MLFVFENNKLLLKSASSAFSIFSILALEYPGVPHGTRGESGVIRLQVCHCVITGFHFFLAMALRHSCIALCSYPCGFSYALMHYFALLCMCNLIFWITADPCFKLQNTIRNTEKTKDVILNLFHRRSTIALVIQITKRSIHNKTYEK